jgi:hypothetical protein
MLELGHLLTLSGLTHPEVLSVVFSGSFFWCAVFLLCWVTCYEAFYLHGVSSFSCSPPIFCPKQGLYLIPLPSLCLFCVLSKCKLKVISTKKVHVRQEIGGLLHVCTRNALGQPGWKCWLIAASWCCRGTYNGVGVFSWTLWGLAYLFLL